MNAEIKKKTGDWETICEYISLDNIVPLLQLTNWRLYKFHDLTNKAFQATVIKRKTAI